ncbi:hypothetical protein RRG08_054513 [Elysia crispata]|uniref:Uncharacterized protein n=1 Tax=Elysia crispata TaxID=231223 RepID=A0AAE1B1J8_9GAST|nr:hypothetical protein RRG08_054513 [Elysia crispata]
MTSLRQGFQLAPHLPNPALPERRSTGLCQAVLDCVPQRQSTLCYRDNHCVLLIHQTVCYRGNQLCATDSPDCVLERQSTVCY